MSVDDKRVLDTNDVAFRTGIKPEEAISYYNKWVKGAVYDKVGKQYVRLLFGPNRKYKSVSRSTSVIGKMQ